MGNERLLATFARTPWKRPERLERPKRPWTPPPPDPRCVVTGCPFPAVVTNWICDVHLFDLPEEVQLRLAYESGSWGDSEESLGFS